jgi:arabinan endo-1,5-alpha-L-arabinosidase
MAPSAHLVRLCALWLCSALAAAPACAPPSSALDVTGAAYALTGDVCQVHDPALAQDADGSLHVFSTDLAGAGGGGGGYLPHRCSATGRDWALCGHVFSALPAWLPAAVPGVRGLWAPDVSFHAASGLWRLYYAASTFGSQRSAIGLATSRSLARPQWVDRGAALASAAGDAFNAIDPSASQVGALLGFGSFWGGLYASPLAASGLAPPAGPGAALQHLAQRPAPPHALEAASLLHVALADGSAQPWLLASYDLCCRGVNSTYSVRAGRWEAQRGAYVDRAGGPLLAGGGTLLLGGGHGWAAAGGQSPLRTAAAALPSAAALLPLALHAYDGVTGAPYLQLVALNFSGAWVAAEPLRV